MVLDLIRALLAALVVAAAPGWFWAGLLRASGDYAERLTYSAALSMALVPATALIPTRLLGLSLTLPTALACALVVFLAGLGAYLRFGAAKGSDEPIFPAPVATLSVPALALLVPAFGLAFGVMIGAIPGVPVADPLHERRRSRSAGTGNGSPPGVRGGDSPPLYVARRTGSELARIPGVARTDLAPARAPRRIIAGARARLPRTRVARLALRARRRPLLPRRDGRQDDEPWGG